MNHSVTRHNGSTVLSNTPFKKLADDSQDNYPRVAQALSKIYIEDLLSGTTTMKKASQQLMGQLPSTRIQPARPFTTAGVDYAGPITIRLGSTCSKQTTKGYIAIFVCFVTKAVHIEVVTSLTTEV